MDMPWIIEARSHIGLAEVPGHELNPVIREFWYSLNAAWLWKQLGSDDSKAPWCGCFVAHCLKESGCAITKNPWRAKAWLDWGQPCIDTDPARDRPARGCVVIYGRKGGGHVGFIVGEDKLGRLMTLGGNQGDRVSILPFARERALGYRWPQEFQLAMPDGPLPVFAPTLAVSNNEA